VVSRLKLIIRNVIVTMCRWMGSPIRDAYTGEKICRGLVCAWEGSVHVIGADAALIPVPIMQKRTTYWRQFIGFTTHPAVDFPRREPAITLLAQSPLAGKPPKVLAVVLDHRDSATINRLHALWCPKFSSSDNLLIAYGGSRSAFDSLPLPRKVYVADPRLRTRDHQREAQSYRGVFACVSDWLRGKDFTHVLFMEGDHVPLAPDLIDQYLNFLIKEDADVAGYHLARIDGTLHPHWLASGADPTKQEVMLSMLGTGHFWKREAWDAVAQYQKSAHLYLELDLPTAAHALGFRIRAMENPGQAVMALPAQLRTTPTQAAALGARSIHPVKHTLT
jgi:hypothetical protein